MLLDALPFPVLLFRRDFSRMLYVNEKAAELIGLNRAALMGTSPETLFTDAASSDREAVRLAILRNGNPIDLDVQLRNTTWNGETAIMAVLGQISLAARGHAVG